jgi:hypothetical protein
VSAQGLTLAPTLARSPSRLVAYLEYFDRQFEGQMGVALAENWRELLRLDYEELSRQAGAAKPAGKAASCAPTV